MPQPTHTPTAADSVNDAAPPDADVMSVLAAAARSVGFTPTDSQLAQLLAHAELIESTNAIINLTGVRTTREIVAKLTVPSIKLLAPAGGWLPTAEWWSGRRVIDVGTGAGFPGIPMAVMLPECHFTLLDARAKKCDFLLGALEILGIENAVVVNARAEDAAQDAAYREQYDVATAMGLARLPVLAELVLPFVAIGGVAVLPKGGDMCYIQDEFQRAAFALDTLGSAPPVVSPSSVGADTDSAERLIYLMKIAPTPARYPRKAGIPRKRPLAAAKALTN